MTSGRTQYRVLIVSAVEKIYEYITEILPPGEFSPILRAASAGEAKRMLVSDEADIVIINTPLPDEFGTELALDLSGGTAGVLLLVKNDYFDQVCYKAHRRQAELEADSLRRGQARRRNERKARQNGAQK